MTVSADMTILGTVSTQFAVPHVTTHHGCCTLYNYMTYILSVAIIGTDTIYKSGDVQ